MPRTSVEPYTHSTSDPNRLRTRVEQIHYDILLKIFILPPEVSLPMQISSSKKEEQLSRVLSFHAYRSSVSLGRHLSELKPDDVKIFCWKDCAVYGLRTDLARQVGSSVGSIDTLDLLERGYRAWFPRRSTDRDVSDGNFWGIPVWLQLRENHMEKTAGGVDEKGNNETVAELEELMQVWTFHGTLCDHLKALAAGIEESRVGKWELRESFAKVVMLIDVGWKENGVKLTWKEDPTKQYVGFAPEELTVVEQEAQGRFWELKCPLERAIRIVASRDAERRGGTRAEWNHQFEEMLVDGDDACEVSDLMHYYQRFNRVCISV